MERHCIFEERTRTFCFDHEGLLAVARIMAEHHLPEVLVLNSANLVVGAYKLSSDGIRFYPAIGNQVHRLAAQRLQGSSIGL